MTSGHLERRELAVLQGGSGVISPDNRSRKMVSKAVGTSDVETTAGESGISDADVDTEGEPHEF